MWLRMLAKPEEFSGVRLAKLVIGWWLTVTSSPFPAADNYIPVEPRAFAKIRKDRSIETISRKTIPRPFYFIYGSINKTNPRDSISHRTLFHTDKISISRVERSDP